MLHGRHYRLVSILTSIIALNYLLALAETRAPQGGVAGRTPSSIGNNQTATATQSDPLVEAAATTTLGDGSRTIVRSELPENATLDKAAAERVRAYKSELLNVLDLPPADKLTPLDQAYLDVFNILREDNDCSRFYGGSRAIEALNELKLQLKISYLDRAVGLRMFGVTVSVTNNTTGISYRLFEHAVLNADGSFFKARLSPLDMSYQRIGEFDANTREARVTILLHEMGHLIRGANGKFILPDDGHDSSVSRENTLRVIKVCRQQIKMESEIDSTQALARSKATPPSNSIQYASIAEPSLPSWANPRSKTH